MSALYKDPIIAKYLELITGVNKSFKGIYQGDPIVIPASMLPALIISKEETMVENFTNAEDRHRVRMIITVVGDLRSEINDDTQVIPGVAGLYDIVEGRDPDTYLLKSTSILYILRANENVDAAHNLATDIDTITVARFQATLGKRDKDAYSVEAQVSFTAHFIQSPRRY